MTKGPFNHGAVALILVAATVSAFADTCLWRRVAVSRSLLPSSLHLEHRALPVSLVVSAAMVCANACCGVRWCNLWCRDPALDACLLSDLIVMPGYVEAERHDATLCFTRRPKDYVTGATIEAGERLREDPRRRKENIVDGIYGYRLDMCFASEYFSNPWFVVDFGVAKPVRFVRILMQNNEFATKHYDYQVRLGSEPRVSHDFYTYRLFGIFDGPAAPNQEIVFRSEAPVMARFVAVLRLSRLRSLQVCHLEVY